MSANDEGQAELRCDKSQGDPERCKHCGCKPKLTICLLEERLQRDALLQTQEPDHA